MQVDAEFPGGNILVDRIEGDKAFLRHDQRDTPHPWFYWCFRVRGAEGRSLTFHFTGGDVIGARGPALSRDRGRAWKWLGREILTDPFTFSYSFPPGEPEVLFSFCPSYHGEHWSSFASRMLGRGTFDISELCRTPRGRPIVRLNLGRLDGLAEHRVLLTCRHHSCETMASYVLEGLLEEILADSPAGQWLRGHVEFLVVPFMDVDGVEEGDQGKFRRPRDHCVDYAGESLYPSVRALKALLPPWSQGRLQVALDLHCPWMRGGDHEHIHFVESPGANDWDALRQFSEILKQVQQGPLVYNGRRDLRAYQGWNTDPPGHMRCTSWASQIPGMRLSAILEFPYATAGGREVNAETARAFGRDLARASHPWLALLK